MCSNGFVSKLSAETQLLPTLYHLLKSPPEELNSPLRYQWQHSVMDAVGADRESLDIRITIAEEAIAVRLTDVKLPNHEERTALNSALRALEKLQQQKA